MDTDVSRERNQRPMSLPVRIMSDEAPYLYNVLCDNARPWNRRLRTEISNFVTPTDSHNAKMRLLGRENEPDR